jgi:hypothetical protein
MLPEPFHFTIDRQRPLLILACSQLKRDVRGMVRFCDLYDGPFWRDLRKSGFPLTNVAAISGLYGYLRPGRPIETYDQLLDDEKVQRTISTGNDLHQLARDVDAAPSAFVVGGRLYREIAAAAARAYDLPKISYASGSFLQLRGQLNAWLRQQAAATDRSAA